MKKYFISLYLLLLAAQAFAQNSLLTNMIKQNAFTFSRSGISFTGEGWRKIDSAVKAASNVLIGEDHFLNEIPTFVSAIAKQATFDNFIIEIDPFTATLLQQKAHSLSKEKFDAYKKDFGNTFSFYALHKEMELLQEMVANKTTIMGTDQVLMVTDRLLCTELSSLTQNDVAKKIYRKIADSSTYYFDAFLKDPSKPFYMLSPGFEKDINKLLALKLSDYEKKQLKDMQLSRRIYMEQNHFLRLQLMKNNFYRYCYNQLQGKKNLYKFGAVHMAKGEGLLGGYDIGNIVYNMADSRFEKSLHIMIAGKTGLQGSPFKHGAPHPLNPDEGDLKVLKPFFNEVTTKEWYCFDTAPVNIALNQGKLTITDLLLRRIIQGYDYIVIIPEVSADSF